MAVHIRLRRDTAANWTATNPILLVGEVGLETDTKKFKVGDGVNAWTALGYWAIAGGGAFTGGISGGNTSGNTGTITNQMVLAGGNNITLSGSTNGAGMTVTVSAGAGGGGGFSGGVSTGGNTAGNTGTQTGQFVLAGGNNVTLSVSTAAGGAQTVTVSAANTVAQTNQSLGIYASSQTTGQSSSSTYDARSLTIVGDGAISVGWSNSSLRISAPNTIAQSNQSLGIYASSQTTGQSSSSTHDARSLTIVGDGAISVGWSNSSLRISAPNTIAQTNQSLGMYHSSQTTGASSSSTYDARSLSVVYSGNISGGWTNGSWLMNVTTAAQSAESNTIGMSNIGNTSGDTAIRSANQLRIVLAGGNNITLSQSTNGSSATITISAFNQSAVSNTIGMSNIGNTSGDTAIRSADQLRIVLAGGNNVTLSQSTNGSSATITISAFNQSNQTLGLYALDNTTGQSTSSTFDARTISFDGLGIASVGFSAGKVIVSVPTGGGGGDGYNIVSMLTSTSGGGTLGATFSALSGSVGLMAGSNITLSQTSNTINIVGPSQYTGSLFEPEVYGTSVGYTQANGTAYFRPFYLNGYFGVNRIAILQQHSSQSVTTWFATGSVSSQTSTGATGTWGQSGTFALFTRKNTNATNADYSNILSYKSGTYTYSYGVSQSASWSTNASSATVSVTTSGAAGFISQIDTAGNITTSSSGSSSSTTFSSTSTNQNSFSSTFTNSFGSQMFSGIRAIYLPLASTVLSPGDYWFYHVQSTTSGSTNNSRLDRLAMQADAGIVAYQTSNQSILSFGSTGTIGTTNLKFGIGSHSASSASTTTMALTAITLLQSNASQYLIMHGQSL